MTWDDETPYLQELAAGVYAYVQPEGGSMVSNCGVITDPARDAVPADSPSTKKRNRALLEAARIDVTLSIPNLWPDTVAVHGGPIETHA